MKLLKGSLKRRREQLGISQADVADGICHQSLLSRIERTDEISNITVLQQLCARLQLRVSNVAKINELTVTPLPVIRYLIDTGKCDQAASRLENTALLRRLPAFALPEYNLLKAKIALAQNQTTVAMQLLQIALGDAEKHQMELMIEIYTEMGATWAKKDEYVYALECYERACGLIKGYRPAVQAEMGNVIANTYYHQSALYLMINDPKKANERITQALEILPAKNHFHQIVKLQKLRVQCCEQLSLLEEKQHAQMLIYAAAEFSKDVNLKDDVKSYLNKI
ncbi:helix-turn-helix domain-containing protein [Weissella hellenica]|uniref:Helix-turn-helix domain-containing protein n=1 Tax=Weissella hellenica TaxID=46256 RepID=A0A4Y4G7G6_WEIHE|nr:helix-turn-helix transcriptional regulator [Weissella hellenica]NKY67766.1 helix-turn-helix domain-containing protein [Weissella hellenica]GED36855.1 transcriptional regulator [Weissella hellenica]SCC15170.1 Helix-turn-helix domain-containing protein [Weissella hellenica]